MSGQQRGVEQAGAKPLLHSHDIGVAQKLPDENSEADRLPVPIAGLHHEERTPLS
jgi:hypothetical protein